MGRVNVGGGKNPTGNALPSDVISPKTFSNGNNVGLVGTIPVLGSEEYPGWRRAEVYLDPNVGRIHLRIPKGAYLTGTDEQGGLVGIFCDDSDYSPNNIPSDINMFGLQGTMPVYKTGSATAAVDTSRDSGIIYLKPPVGYFNGDWVFSADPNYTAENILGNISIFGLQGSIPVVNADYQDSIPANNRMVWNGWPDGKTYVLLALPQNKAYLGGNVNWLRFEEPNFLAANIVKDKTILGLTGTAPVPVSGTAQCSTFQQTFFGGAGSSQVNFIEVSGLTFKPRQIIASCDNSGTGGNYSKTLYNENNVQPGYLSILTTSISQQFHTTEFDAGTNAYVNSTGFKLPIVGYNYMPVNWTAIP